MKPKTFFILITIIALAYLVYWFINKPEKKFGEITIKNSSYSSEIKKTPKLVFQTKPNVFGINVPVYKIEKKLQNKLSFDQAKDIANILGIKDKGTTVDLGNAKLYKFENNGTNVGVLDYGLIQYYIIENTPNKTYDKKAITEIIKKSNLDKIVPLPENYNININKVESDGSTSELTKYLTVFSITPKINKTFSYRDNLAQNLYYGNIKPIIVDNAITGYKIEINTWYSLVFKILDTSTYKTISLKNALNILEESPEKVFVEINSKEVHNPTIDTNSLNISNTEIVYFIQKNMLVSLFHFEGKNRYNQNDTGIVNIYIPAI